MKNITKLILLIIITISFSSCEDVVDVAVNSSQPKLVIDASIQWQKGTIGNQQMIKLSKTSDYFNSEIPTVSNATVYITNSTGSIFNFNEITPNGQYICTDFIPAINESYTLTVISEGTTYTSTEKLLATPTIDSIEQKSVSGFAGDEIQIKFFYQDNGSENNYYLIKFKNNQIPFPEFSAVRDEFFQGNQMFGFYSNSDLKKDDVLDMTLQGINERYQNYMNKLIAISGSNGGNPFATPPATLKGNIVNQTNSKNYPLGYFNLSEIDTRTYTVQ